MANGKPGRPPGSKNKTTTAKTTKSTKATKSTKSTKTSKVNQDPDAKIRCFCCDDIKHEREFYSSPNSKIWKMNNHKIPICINCCRALYSEILAAHGKTSAMIAMCALLDWPYVPTTYEAVYEKIRHSATLGHYSRAMNSRLNPWGRATFVDSIVGGNVLTKSPDVVRQEFEERWSKADSINKKSVLSRVGYDPFEGMTQKDRKEGFNVLAGYLDMEGVASDAHRLNAAINLVQTQLQIKHIDESINEITSGDMINSTNIMNIKDLMTTRKNAVMVLNSMAKENHFSSRNDDKAKSNFTSKVKELLDNNYEGIKVNMYDINTSESMRQMMDLSHQSIIHNLDDNDYADIISEQREMIRSMREELDGANEELRLAQNTIIALRATMSGKPYSGYGDDVNDDNDDNSV